MWEDHQHVRSGVLYPILIRHWCAASAPPDFKIQQRMTTVLWNRIAKVRGAFEGLRMLRYTLMMLLSTEYEHERM
jgi:hypothetical protein